MAGPYHPTPTPLISTSPTDPYTPPFRRSTVPYLGRARNGTAIPLLTLHDTLSATDYVTGRATQHPPPVDLSDH